MLEINKIHNIDCLEGLKMLDDCSIQTCVTSPPYWGLRDYGHDSQFGLEETPEQYVERLVNVFREVRRVLRDDGTLWLNLGDTYVRRPQRTTSTDKNAGLHKGRTTEVARDQRKMPDGLKVKDMVGIPWRVAFSLQADGWYLRSDIIWNKPNAMPESVRDRPTKAHEYIFLLSKSRKYHYDHEAIKEPAIYRPGKDGDFQREGSKREQPIHGQKYGTHRPNRKPREDKKKGEFSGKWDGEQTDGQQSFRAIRDMKNKRSVWNVSTKPFKEAHFAVFPAGLIEPCILAGCPEQGIVLDPFMGAGTTALVAKKLNRQWIGFELNPEYVELANKRIG